VVSGKGTLRDRQCLLVALARGTGAMPDRLTSSATGGAGAGML